MDRKTSDGIVALAIATVLVGGGVLTWQATQRRQTDHMGSMMDGSTTMGGTDPIVYAVGTILAVALLVGFYAIVRGDERTTTTPPAADGRQANATGPTATSADGTTATNTAPDPSSTPDAESVPEGGSGPSAASKQASEQSEQSQATGEQSDDDGDERKQLRQVLELLPEDERRILRPVVESPGLTQIALRDRSDFSKSKVSQTVSELEKRGLLYREKQGRTYRIYPDDDLAGRLDD